MRITGSKLRRIIREELIREGYVGDSSYGRSSSVRMRMQLPSLSKEPVLASGALYEALKTAEADGTLVSDPVVARDMLRTWIGKTVLIPTSGDLVQLATYQQHETGDYYDEYFHKNIEYADVLFDTNIDGTVVPYVLKNVIGGVRNIGTQHIHSDFERMMGKEDYTTTQQMPAPVKLVLEKAAPVYPLEDFEAASGVSQKLVVTATDAIIMLERLPDIAESLSIKVSELDKSGKKSLVAMDAIAADPSLMKIDMSYRPADPVLNILYYEIDIAGSNSFSAFKQSF